MSKQEPFRKYMIFNYIQSYHNPDGEYKIKCYQDGKFYVCPNPNDQTEVGKCEELYGANEFIIIQLDKEQFYNSRAWYKKEEINM